MQPLPDQASPSIRRMVAAAALAAIPVALVLTATFNHRPLTDGLMNGYQTRALALHADLDLSRYEASRGLSRFANAAEVDGELRSTYGVAVSITSLPVYALLARVGADEAALEGTTAILHTTVAAVLMFALFGRKFGATAAALGTALLVFGTTLWPTGTTSFWAHGPAMVFVAIGMHGLFSSSGRAPLLAGAALGWAVVMRPPLLILLFIAGATYVGRARDATRYALTAGTAVVVLVAHNLVLWGDLRGGYARHPDYGFQADLGSSLFGMLLGWWRGLFVYSPVFIIAAVGLVLAFRDRSAVARRSRILGIAALGLILLYASWEAWPGGITQFGYRLLLDATPFLVFLVLYAVIHEARVRTATLGLGALSVLIMAIGAAPNGRGWDYAEPAETIVQASLGQATIAAIDDPLALVMRLALVVAAIGALLVIARWCWPRSTQGEADAV